MAQSEITLTRRKFVASTSAVGAMTALALVGCAQEPKSGDADEQVEADASPESPEAPKPVAAPVEEKYFISTCRGNCGGDCYLKGLVREGKLVSTTPYTFGNDCEGVEQGCVKGLANPLRVYGAHRLLHPMRRVGERGAGQWEKISWDEAIQTIADKMTAAIDEYGPASICFQGGAGNMGQFLSGHPLQIFNAAPSFGPGVGASRFIQKIGATCLSNGDDMAGLYLRAVIMGLPSNSLDDMINSKNIVIWGSNPAEASFSRSSWYYVCKAKEAGARITVIDPLYTSSAAHADEWIPIRCGTDSALMCAMANYIVSNGLENTEYLKKGSVAPLLIREDGSYLRLSDVGQPLEVVEGKDGQKTEVDQPVVWDNAASSYVSYKAAQDPELHGTFDVEGVSVRTVYDAALENIAPFTVEFAAQECGIPAETIEGLARRVAVEAPTTFSIDWGIEHTYNSWKIYFASALLAALTGSVGVEGGSYVTGGSTPGSVIKPPAKTDQSACKLEDAKPVKCITGDYLCEIMETGKWAGEDFPVRVLYVHACDPLDNFSGPTDLMKAYDKIDFIVTSELFMTTTANYSDIVLPATMPWEAEDFDRNGFMIQKAIEPLGEAKSDFEMYCLIAKAMGYDDLFPKSGEEYLRELLDTPENIEAGLGYDTFHEQGVVIGDYAKKDAPTLGQETNALGLTQFYLEVLPPRDNWGQTFELKDRLPHYQKSIEADPDSPDRAKYPLFGFSGHDNYHGQSVWAHNAWLDNFRTVGGKPFCRIHEKAAAERGIKTGDTVRIFNDHGTCVLSALVTPGIQEESVWVPHGFFWDEFDEGFAAALTGHYPDPVTSNSNFNDWICEVEKVEGGVR